MPAVHELFELAFAHNGVAHIEPAILALHRPIHLEGAVQPLVALARQDKLGRAQTVCHTLKTIAETMRKVVGWIHVPRRARAEMRRLLFGDAVGGQVPHLRVVARHQIHFHPQHGLAGRILAVAHAPEFCQVHLRCLLGVLAAVPRTLFAVLAAALLCHLGLGAVTDIGPVDTDELLGQATEPLEIVARVRHCMRSVPQPPDVFANGRKVLLFFRVWVRVVETEDRLPAVELGKPEIDGNRFRMANVQVPIGLRWEACDDVRVWSNGVHFCEKALLENGIFVDGRGDGFGWYRRRQRRSFGRPLCPRSFCRCLFGPFCCPLLQFILRHHFSRHLVQLQFGRRGGECVGHVVVVVLSVVDVVD